MSVDFHEENEGYDNGYMRKETYQTEVTMKIKFDLLTYILENTDSVIHLTSALHYTITNHAYLIPKDIF